MGYRLADAAEAVAARLGLAHAPARLFTHMARKASDDDRQPVYFAGQERMALAIGADAGADAGRLALNRARRALVKAGVVRVEAKSAPGRNAVYALLDGGGKPLSAAPSAENGYRSATPEVIHRPDDGYRLPTPERVSVSDRTGIDKRTNGYRSATERVSVSDTPKGEGSQGKEGMRASAPPRTCTKHESWDHSMPCRDCGNDRRAAEAHQTQRRPATMSARRIDCADENRQHRWLADGTCMACETRRYDSEPEPAYAEGTEEEW